jgi:RNA polymerase sigma-70 factor (ECF subfamily)
LTEERVARAVDVLSRCSPSARRVFRLAYGGEGLSHSEVAQRVGLSLQRVRQILCEVRAKLRLELEREKEE